MRQGSLLCLIVVLAPVLSESISRVQGVTVTRTVKGSSPALKVSWNAVNGSGITYTVCYGTNGGTQSDPPSGANCSTSGLTGTSTTLGPLHNGTTYYIWVRAESSDRQGPYSKREEQIACNVPSRPTLLAVFYKLYIPFEVGVTVTWRAPQSDCPITAYEVQYKISSDTSWSTPPVSKSSRSRKHDWMRLSPNTSYDVRVRAVSAAGNGTWSDVGQAMTPGVPGPVRSLSATQIAVNGAPALHLRWSPPVDKAGGGLTYRLRVVPPHVNISRPVTATEYNVRGLRANTRYTVYVRAVSSGLYGPEESVVNTTGKKVVPKIQDVTVTRTVQGLSPALRVSWSAVSRSGFTYTVCYSTKSGRQSDPPSGAHANCGTSGITGTYTTLHPLSKGTTYYIWVRAKSSGRRGPYSNRVQQETYNVPGPVTSLQVRPSTTTYGLVLTWGPPSGSNYPTPVTYRVRYRERPSSGPPGSWSSTVGRSATQREYTTPIHKPGTRYEVEVWAVTSIGEGSISNGTASAYQNPGPVTDPKLKPSNTTIYGLVMTWGPPSGSNYPTPVTYQVRYCERPSSGPPGSWSSSVVRSATQRKYTTPALKPGTRYEVEVWTVTSIGRGTSIRRTATTHQAPGPVTALNVTSHLTDIALIVTWQPPTGPTRPPIEGYKVRYRESPNGQWSKTVQTSAETNQYTLSGLQPAITYEVQVWAFSRIGEDPLSRRVVSETTGGPPDNITLRVNAVTTSSITVNPSGPSGEVSYEETGSSDGPTTLPYSSSITISNLKPNTWYTIAYTVQNSYGTKMTKVTGLTIPKAPTRLLLEAMSRALTTTWTAPTNHQSLVYHVNYSSPLTGQNSTTTSDTTLTLTGLHPYEEYTISVQAGNKGGLSVPVNGTVRMHSDIPSKPPHNILNRSRSTTWIELTWTIPLAGGRNGIIINYVIDLSSRDENITDVVQTPTFSSPENLYYNITGLSAGSEYTVRVAASTVNGTGPFTALRIKTLDDVPEPVRNLTFEVIPQSEGSVRISWVAPAVTNGDIVSYEVTYGVLDSTDMKQKTVSNPPVVLTNLTGQTPYRVGVRAGTSQGFGEATSIVVFSSEGVPRMPVSKPTAFWKDGVVNISWISLSLVEARGFPLYIISYTSYNRTMRTINTTNSSIMISGLEPKQTYTFTVQVTTGNGTNKGQTANVTLAPLDDPETGGDSSIMVVAAAAAIPTVLIIVVVIVAFVILVCVRRRKVSQSTALKTKSDKSEYPLQPIGIVDMTIDAGSIADVSEDVLGTDGRIIPRARFTDTTNFLHLNRDHGFEEEFKTIINDPDGSDVIAKANRHKNRYGNIYTYDHSRVVLNVPDSNGNDYINASFIDGYIGQNAYIAAQGPTPATISDFWQMIWDQKCPVIVMLTNIEENGKRKCEQYWNEDMDCPLEPGRDLSVRVTSLMGYANYVIREITLTNMSSTHCKPLKVKHFHFTTWPDFGVPTHPSSLVKFVQQVRKEYKDSTAPMVVHCSAGVGRTGTFITIDAMMERLNEQDNLNIYQFVTEMRSRRTFMVQTMDQYAFIHDALCDYLTCGDTSIPAHQLRVEIGDMDKVDNDTRMSGFESQFKLLDSVSKKPASADETFSKKSVVEKKNRYKDRFPYSNSYLHISGKGTTSGSDYFNASFVDSYSRKKAFIAAQAPLESTRNDAWEMIWQLKPSTIVLLCDFKEGKEISCLRFWPDEHSKVTDYGVLKVSNVDTTQKDAGYDVITLEVFDRRKESGGVRTITLFHLRNWYKNGRPPLEAILRLMGDVENATISTPGDVPAMVMCDDGMGRSGVFICAMSEVERVKVEGQVDVFQTIKGMRIQRPHMVDTPDQYKLCFDILQSYLDSFDTYANFKTV